MHPKLFHKPISVDLAKEREHSLALNILEHAHSPQETVEDTARPSLSEAYGSSEARLKHSELVSPQFHPLQASVSNTLPIRFLRTT